MSRVIADGLSPRAQNDLNFDIETQIVELGGDFDAGAEIIIHRIGRLVTIQGVGLNTTHPLLAIANSTTGVIPAQFRPPSNPVKNMLQYAGADVGADAFCQIDIDDDGTFRLRYYDAAGATVTRAGPGTVVAISYLNSDTL